MVSSVIAETRVIEGGASHYRISEALRGDIAREFVMRGDTSAGPWEHPARPLAGANELRWFRQSPEELAAYQNRWVGIIGRRVVAHGDAMREVVDQLRERGIWGALVVRVPADLTKREYFIGCQ